VISDMLCSVLRVAAE